MRLFIKNHMRLIIAGYILFIFATLPFLPKLVSLIINSIGSYYYGWLINLTIIIPLFIVFYMLWKNNRPSIGLVLFPVILLTFFLWHFELLRAPAEKIHFIEYGWLGLMLTWRKDRLNWQYLLAVSSLIIVVGALDEYIQYLLPMRVGDMQDVYMNITGGFMGLWTGKSILKKNKFFHEKCSKD